MFCYPDVTFALVFSADKDVLEVGEILGEYTWRMVPAFVRTILKLTTIIQQRKFNNNYDKNNNKYSLFYQFLNVFVFLENSKI